MTAEYSRHKPEQLLVTENCRLFSQITLWLLDVPERCRHLASNPMADAHTNVSLSPKLARDCWQWPLLMLTVHRAAVWNAFSWTRRGARLSVFSGPMRRHAPLFFCSLAKSGSGVRSGLRRPEPVVCKHHESENRAYLRNLKKSASSFFEHCALPGYIYFIFCSPRLINFLAQR